MCCVEPFYGAAARDQLLTQLAGHYGAAMTYLEASLRPDETLALVGLKDGIRHLPSQLSGDE